MTEVLNLDVKGLHDRVNRVIVEVNKAASGNVAAISSADLGRFKSYTGLLKGYVGFIDAQAPLDLPETNPRGFLLDEAPVVQNVENEDVNDIVRMLVTIRDELGGSQSAKLASGVLEFDRDRFLAGIGRVDSFLTDYVEKMSPFDLPETAPMAPTVAAGN